MRLDMFFTVVAVVAAFFAVRLGDTANLYWKAAVQSASAPDPQGSGAFIFLGIVFLMAAFLLLMSIFFYFASDYYHECHTDTDEIEKGTITILAAFCGFYIYAFFVGPLNNVGASWFDGWAIIAFAGAVPAVLNINSRIQDVIEERRSANQPAQDEPKALFRHRE